MDWLTSFKQNTASACVLNKQTKKISKQKHCFALTFCSSKKTVSDVEEV
jgi:hypothetical protein